MSKIEHEAGDCQEHDYCKLYRNLDSLCREFLLTRKNQGENWPNAAGDLLMVLANSVGKLMAYVASKETPESDLIDMTTEFKNQVIEIAMIKIEQQKRNG